MSSPGGVRYLHRVFCVLEGGGEACNQLAGPQGTVTAAGSPSLLLGDFKHSDSIVAQDQHGNVCSMHHTANSLPFGSGIFVQVCRFSRRVRDDRCLQGVALPNSGSIFKGFVANVPAGRRLPSG